MGSFWLAFAYLSAILIVLVLACADGEQKEAEMGIVHRGPKNPNWRGGRSVAANGYVLIRVGKGHPLSDVRGYAYEHRVVAEQKIGRALAKGEHVHHIDGNKQNNAPENLEVLTHVDHRVEHRKRADLRLPGEPNPEIACGCNCGQSLLRYDSSGRPRRFISGHNPSKTSRYHGALLGALRSGPKTRKQLAESSGASAEFAHAVLLRMEAAGEVVQVCHGTWALAPAPTDLPLELARAVAEHLLSAGIRVDGNSAAEIASALRDVAAAYDAWTATMEAA
jgi:hypothetical protein